MSITEKPLEVIHELPIKSDDSQDIMIHMEGIPSECTGKSFIEIGASQSWSPLIVNHLTTSDRTIEKWSQVLTDFDKTNLMPQCYDESYVHSIEEVDQRVDELCKLRGLPHIPFGVKKRLCSEVTSFQIPRQVRVLLFARLFSYSKKLLTHPLEVAKLYTELMAVIITAAYHLDGVETFAAIRKLSRRAKIASLGAIIGNDDTYVMHFAAKDGRYTGPGTRDDEGSRSGKGLELLLGQRYVVYFLIQTDSFCFKAGAFSDYTLWSRTGPVDYLRRGTERFAIRPPDTPGLLEIIHRTVPGDGISKGWVYSGYFVYIREMLLAAHGKKIPLTVVDLEDFLNNFYLPMDFRKNYEAHIMDSGETSLEKDKFSNGYDSWILNFRRISGGFDLVYQTEWDDPCADLMNCYHSLGMAKQNLFTEYMTAIEDLEENNERRILSNALPAIESVFSELWNALQSPIDKGTAMGIIKPISDFFLGMSSTGVGLKDKEMAEMHKKMVQRIRKCKRDTQEAGPSGMVCSKKPKIQSNETNNLEAVD